MQKAPTISGTTNLIDILDRVLDKGLVIAGDIRVSLANVELLTIRIRLLICSVDKAEQIGMNWWKYDPNLTSPAPIATPHLSQGLPPGVVRRAAARRADVSDRVITPKRSNKRSNAGTKSSKGTKRR